MAQYTTQYIAQYITQYTTQYITQYMVLILYSLFVRAVTVWAVHAAQF